MIISFFYLYFKVMQKTCYRFMKRFRWKLLIGNDIFSIETWLIDRKIRINTNIIYIQMYQTLHVHYIFMCKYWSGYLSVSNWMNKIKSCFFPDVFKAMNINLERVSHLFNKSLNFYFQTQFNPEIFVNSGPGVVFFLKCEISYI